MDSSEMREKGLSRRKFMKGAAVIAGAGLAAGCTPKVATQPTPQAVATQPGSAAMPAATGVEASWMVPPKPVAKTEIKQTVSADVVVIGAGVAGLMAALSAAEAGAKTVLIEKSEKFNARGGHNAAIQSKIQKSEGLNYDPAQVARDLIRWAGNKVNGGLVMLWATKCSEVMDYLIDLAAANSIQVQRWGNDVPKQYWTEYKTVHIFGAMDETILAGMLEKTGKAKGVEFHYSTPAQYLLREGEGRVTGVVAKDANGSYLQFDAKKGVILCTGDYGHDPEMIKYYCPEAAIVDSNVYSPAVNTGDGHKMGLWVGAAMQDEQHHACMVHNLGGAPFSGNPFLRVNKFGLRYENEDVPIPYMANSVQLQPEHKTWTIYDSTFKEDLPKAGTSFSRVNAASDTTLQSIDKAVTAGKVAFKADTLDDLAQKMGVPVDAFKATVARYNELVKKGKDDDFGKSPEMMTAIDTPPYYAVYNPLALLVTLGGLKCNTKLQCLDAKGSVISGLYAAGNTVGDFFANDYPVIVPGCSHSRAWTFGRLAGQNVVAEG